MLLSILLKLTKNERQIKGTTKGFQSHSTRMMPVPNLVFLVVKSFDHKVHKDFHKEHQGKKRVFSRSMME